jgi:hypothetical protein
MDHLVTDRHFYLAVAALILATASFVGVVIG